VIDSSTLITNSTVAVDSIFYATFYDTINDCYSPTTAVTVIIDNDCCTDPNLFADNCDCDGDGIKNRDDLDDDNDGILDSLESLTKIHVANTVLTEEVDGAGDRTGSGYFLIDIEDDLGISAGTRCWPD